MCDVLGFPEEVCRPTRAEGREGSAVAIQVERRQADLQELPKGLLRAGKESLLARLPSAEVSHPLRKAGVLDLDELAEAKRTTRLRVVDNNHRPIVLELSEVRRSDDVATREAPHLARPQQSAEASPKDQRRTQSEFPHRTTRREAQSESRRDHSLPK